MAKREGIGGVISILDSPAVAEAVAGLRCWIRELANFEHRLHRFEQQISLITRNY
ncbi:MAG: hypothetical protein ACYSUY_10700 [Planctomycetota bacterium]